MFSYFLRLSDFKLPIVVFFPLQIFNHFSFYRVNAFQISILDVGVADGLSAKCVFSLYLVRRPEVHSVHSHFLFYFFLLSPDSVLTPNNLVPHAKNSSKDLAFPSIYSTADNTHKQSITPAEEKSSTRHFTSSRKAELITSYVAAILLQTSLNWSLSNCGVPAINTKPSVTATGWLRCV